MRKLIKTLLVFGWFFAAQMPLGSATSPEATVTQVVGPFKTATECKATSDEVEATLKAVGLNVRLLPCQFKQEA